MPIIELENVGKQFAARRGTGLLFGRRGIVDWVRGRRTERFDALRGITFNVEPGESFGIIGPNGSGKSTLLKILAGVTAPTTGHVRVRGRMASLLELGAGFHPMLTGRENIYLNGRILGMSRRDVNGVFDRIVEFSGIGSFIDNPVETYSSGMFVRLAFSVAVHSNPDIFLVDEVLAVGDEEFQRRCRQRIVELRDQGKTILFVSHDLGLVHALCDHVVLLTKGEMVTRGSPQKTIEYYLRQSGSPDGVHTFKEGDVDAVFANGRISLFRDRAEVSAPGGLRAEVYSMEACHHCHEADWRVVEKGPSRCVARGRMSRLPMVQVWDIRLETDRLRWDVAVECDRPTPVSSVNANLAFPAAYAEWVYGDLTGPFPDFNPADLTWSLVSAYTAPCREAAAFPSAQSPLPPIDIALRSAYPYVRLLWFNSDYAMGSRILQVNTLLPAHEATLPAGRTALFTLEIDLGSSRESIHVRTRSVRTIQSGPVTARFDNGVVRMAYSGTELTCGAHVYSSLLIDHLWNDSRTLQWGSLERAGDGIRVTGISRRAPFEQTWEIHPDPRGIRFRVWLEALSDVDLQEYHVSAMLRSEYDAWESPYEAGAFPPIPPEQDDWVHLNHDYRPGERITAHSSSRPAIAIASHPVEDHKPIGVPRMTALNATFFESARVIQALHTSNHGVFHLAKGRQLLFDGLLEIQGS